MKSKTLVILAVVAVVLAIALMVTTRRGGDAAKAPEVRGLLLPAAREQMGAISRVGIKRGAVEVVLELREAGGRPAWVVANKHGYPADSGRVRSTVSELLESRVVEPKTSKPENYARLGVADADAAGAGGLVVTLSSAEGKELGAVIVGNASNAPRAEDDTRPHYYVRRKGEAPSYVASGSLGVAAEPMSWVNRTIIDLQGAPVRSATITHKAAGQADQVLTVSKAAREENQFKLETLPEGRQPKDDYAPTRVGQGIASVTIDDVAPAASVDMSAPEVVCEFRAFDGTVISGSRVSKDGQKWWGFRASYEEPPAPVHAEGADEATRAETDKKAAEERLAAQVRVEELNKRLSGWVFILPAYKDQALATKLEEVLKPVEAPPAPPVSPVQPEAVPAAPQG